MEKEKELTVDLKDYVLDPSKDYRQKLTMWRVDENGNLIWVKTKFGTNKSYYIIEKSRLMHVLTSRHVKWLVLQN